jgi:hypothetical protein
MKILILIMINILFQQTVIAITALPEAWLSTENESYRIQNSNKGLGFKKSLSKYVNKIYNTHENILDTSEEESKKSSKKSKWRMDGYKTDLAISKGGILGFSSLKGKAAVELTWKKKTINKFSKIEPIPSAPLNIGKITIDQDTDKDNIVSQMEEMLEPSVKSGKIKKSKKLKNKLRKKAERLLFISQAVSSMNEEEYYAWVPHKFRFDLVFGKTGNLLSVVKLGGDIRFRFEWEITRIAKTGPYQYNLENTKAVRNLISMIASDLSSISEARPTLQGDALKFNGFSIGIGFSQKEVFGIATFKTSQMGTLYFKKQKRMKPMKALTEEEIAKMEYSYLNHKEANGKIVKKAKLHKIKRKKFRKGILKSIKIADFFVEKANKKTDSKWEISKLKTFYSLGVSGMFGLSKVTGTVATELFYKR